MHATIAGKPASLDEAAEAAADLLRSSRYPLITGMATDHDGATAALQLAERIGAVVDHVQADAMLAHLDAMRSGGWIAVTPPAARKTADLILLVGDRAHAPDGSAKVVRLPRGSGPDAIAVALGALRALVSNRPVRLTNAQRAGLQPLADALRHARYAVIATGEISTLAIEMAAGLVADLAATTRSAVLATPPSANATGVAFALSALCGYPIRVRLDGGRAEHDPWRFDTRRILAEREADALVWIDAFAAAGPPSEAGIPTIALGAHAPGARVSFPVGRPGEDHDAVLFDDALGGLRAVASPVASPGARKIPSAAAILRRIAELC